MGSELKMNKTGKYALYLPFILLILIALGYFIWFKCGDYCRQLLNDNWLSLLIRINPYIRKLAIILSLFIVFKITDNLILKKFFRRVFRGFGMEEKYARLSKFLVFVWWVLYGIVALSLIVGNILGLIASLGLIGFGITFALQKPILNFVGWITIIFKNTYSEGDRIKVGAVRGDVKEIQVMNTVLDGLLENSDMPSGKIVTFPNELVLTSEVQNFTKDSNYIVEEMDVSITYESNYHNAIALLRGIIIEQIKRNKPQYINRIHSQKKKIDYFINKLISSKGHSKKTDNDLEREAEVLKKEKEQIDNDLREIEDEFRPKIRVELKDSSIQLTAQFFTPYNQIKKNRTEIYLAFMDAIKKEADIEIAYPHMQIVNKN